MILRINVWISYKGLQKTAYTGIKFPYRALCLSDRKNREFSSITDIYCELVKLYDIAKNKGFNLGEALYTQSFFFANHDLLINTESQNRIKEYQFCKKFKCPPYPSLQNTPANIIDDFMIIDEEYNLCMEHSQKEKKDK